MNEPQKVSEATRIRNASEQLGWRLNTVESSVRAIISHFDNFGIEGTQARKFRESLEEIAKAFRERFMEATGGK